ncbi:MAG: porin family protein [Cyclobacteriaceae bacterium]
MMIRRLLILFVVSLIYIPAHSQVLISLLLGDNLNSGKVEFGLDGGLNLSNQGGLSQSKILSSFNLGFYFDIKLKQSPWMIHTGVIVKSNVGAAGLPVYSLNDADLDNAFVGGSIERKLSYFHVPVLMKYNFTNHFFLEAGPQLGLLYKAYDEFTNTVQSDDLTYRNEIRDGFHRLDAGLTTGIGYHRLTKGHGMNLGVRYYYGFVDVVIDDTGSSITNRSLYFTVGIPIGAGKAAEKAANKEKR